MVTSPYSFYPSLLFLLEMNEEVVPTIESKQGVSIMNSTISIHTIGSVQAIPDTSNWRRSNGRQVEVGRNFTSTKERLNWRSDKWNSGSYGLVSW